MHLLDQSAPRDVPQVVSTGVKLGARAFLVVAALQLVAQVVNYLVSSALLDPRVLSQASVVYPWREFGVALLVMMIAGTFLGAISFGYMWDVGTTGGADLRRAVRAAPRATVMVLVQAVPFMIMLIIGLVLLIVPGVILAVGLVLAPVAVVIEGRGPIAGLNRSWELVWGRWWRCLGVVACVGIAMIAIHLLITRVGGMPSCASLTPQQCVAAVGDVGPAWLVVYSALNAALAPFVCGVMLALFHDLRFRVANLPLRTDPVT